MFSFRQFAAVWQTFQFHTITNGYPKRNDLYDYYKIADYCQRDFIEELYFILVTGFLSLSPLLISLWI